MQVQFEITDPNVDVAPMAFPNNEARSAVLDYILSQHGIQLSGLAQIVFTRIDDDGTRTIEQALQYGKDVTRNARFV